MKTFKINNKTIYFGSNASNNTKLVDLFKEYNPKGLWFHLSNNPSSHGFYLEDTNLEKDEINIIGNILLCLSKLNKNNKIKYKMDICSLHDLKTTKTAGLVKIKNEKIVVIKNIMNFNLEDYK